MLACMEYLALLALAAVAKLVSQHDIEFDGARATMCIYEWQDQRGNVVRRMHLVPQGNKCPPTLEVR
jgi:hypothetical protein